MLEETNPFATERCKSKKGASVSAFLTVVQVEKLS